MQSSLPRNLTNVPTPKIQRSAFDRSCGYKTTFNVGLLIPVFLDEVIPGDTINLSATFFARLSTTIHPIMDNLHLDSQFFFCPSRLLDVNFKKVMGEQDNPTDSTDVLVSRMDPATYPVAGFAELSLADYLGLPTKVAPPIGGFPYSLNAYPFLMYNFTWNHWYRDQNLQDSVYFNNDLALHDYAEFTLLRRGKRKDYFTGALPWPQKGDASLLPILLPSGVESNDAAIQFDVPAAGVTNRTIEIVSGTNNAQLEGAAIGTTGNIVFGDETGLEFGDPGSVGNVNDLRTAVQIQKFLERDARYGTRYPEFVFAHFGVVTPDLLWRPEYLGGSSDRINVHPVEQTSATGATGTPQGNLSGVGTIVSQPSFVKSFNEHGYIMGLVSVRADLNYQQNFDRLWLRVSKFDFYMPEFAHLGEQEILLAEIFFEALSTLNPQMLFGYAERYSEYRYKNNTITGLFRSNATLTLDAWHLAQEFDVISPPVLSADFIEEDPPVDRVVAVTTEPQIIFDSIFKIRHVRPMPVIAVPGLMDHF